MVYIYFDIDFHLSNPLAWISPKTSISSKLLPNLLNSKRKIRCDNILWLLADKYVISSLKGWILRVFLTIFKKWLIEIFWDLKYHSFSLLRVWRATQSRKVSCVRLFILYLFSECPPGCCEKANIIPVPDIVFEGSVTSSMVEHRYTSALPLIPLFSLSSSSLLFLEG